ncbi:AraC family transcriptional regulator [Arthrobacter ginkgonis]|uniref:AraC family transcriptional regulator n=1 Tax=Arthrobacter ginkgonis TaxID=1630594 RepID=A0ABP7BT59_9MICC
MTTVDYRHGFADAPLLGSRPLARSTSPRAIRDAVDGLTGEHHQLLLHQGTRLDGAVHGLQLGPLGIVHVAYGAGLTVDSPPSGRRVVVVIPLGPMFVESCENRWVASTPFALSSRHRTQMAPDPVRGALVAATDAGIIEAQLESRLGGPLRSPVSLSSERPLQLAAPALVSAAWLEACRTLEDRQLLEDGIFRQALVASLLANMTLGLAPHLTAALSGAGQGPGERAVARSGPDYVRAARRIMEQRCAEELTVEAVAAAVGISPRQLHAAFAEFLDTTPSQLLREIRLERARALLQDPSGAHRLTVAAAATGSGFSHLGRFSAYYLQRYGEAPSATLARAKS